MVPSDDSDDDFFYMDLPVIQDLGVLIPFTMFERFRRAASSNPLSKSYYSSKDFKIIGYYDSPLGFGVPQASETNVQEDRSLIPLLISQAKIPVISTKIRVGKIRHQAGGRSSQLTLGVETEKSSHSKVHKEATHDEAFDEDSDDDEMDFIVKIFQHLAKKKSIFSSRSCGFKGSNFRSDKDGRKGYFNCKKSDHFIVGYPDMQKYKVKKEIFQKKNFISKLKKVLMETWEELDNEEEIDKEEANLDFMASTLSDSELEAGSNSDSEDT
ncbi:hypothetical protein KIW84_063656 [Lathyrus oleraceus]|uniref:Uncharacterized protein n=1 Tax=Pisum sativum TaxID=3888 RepID=A0A9D4WAM0_PEA|nr:hypothetical protein KIW84_063656 [Pisum sativum]